MRRVSPVVIALAACALPVGPDGLHAGNRVERVPEPPPAVTGEAPAEVLQRIRADLATRTKRDTKALRPIRDEAVTWSDGALGCPRFGEMYPQLPTQGYWIMFEVEGRLYDYRVDSQGRFRLCENPRGSGKLPADDR
jgi:hypothetical protein